MYSFDQRLGKLFNFISFIDVVLIKLKGSYYATVAGSDVSVDRLIRYTLSGRKKALGI